MPIHYLIPSGLLLIAFFVLLMSSLLRKEKFDRELLQSEAWYHSFFENSPISLWEEDFSEVKAFIDRLRNSGVKDFRTYFKNHPDDVLSCAGMVKIVDINKATMRLYNAESKEAFMGGLNNVFGQEVHDPFIEELVAIALGSPSFESEDINQTITGEKKDIFLKWSVVPGHEVDYSKVLVSIIDITERKHAEQAMRESEKRYRDLVENISELYFVCDDQGLVVYGSPNFFSETGYSPAEITGKPFLRMIAPDHRARVLEFFRARANDGTIDTTFEFMARRKDGRLTWVEQSTRIIRDPQGNVKEYRNVVRDVTKKKEAQNELIAREKRFRALIEENFDVIALLDGGGTIQYVSPSVFRVLGYSPEELSGRNVFDVIHESDMEFTAAQLKAIVSEPSRPAVGRLRVKRKNGAWCWVEGVGKNLLYDPSVSAIVANFRVVTERYVSEELMRQLPIRIINAQESERRRVARDLHDSVNQILSSVKFRMESIEEKVRRKDEGLKRDVAGASMFLEKAMNEVRRISRNLRPSELDDLGVVPAVRSMCEEFKEVTKIDVNLTFSRFPQKLSPELEVTMYRIIQEALSNVAKHSEATRLTIRCSKENSLLKIKIKDNGKGSERQTLPVDSPRYTGMGLLNMKERAAFVGGTVSVLSSPKRGMEIDVQLPF